MKRKEIVQKIHCTRETNGEEGGRKDYIYPGRRHFGTAENMHVSEKPQFVVYGGADPDSKRPQFHL